ncbi:hypothetical protein C7M84_023426 [Penaeus vannamei]|uniref:Uncharacterized protein n=1 Tax=Penaeus vannamei TaxID=6689 RepID=A0A3R7Q1C6_PENVA|nr:hypothetical protein C7M84_023426 [Penaeus vannamei]
MPVTGSNKKCAGIQGACGAPARPICGLVGFLNSGRAEGHLSPPGAMRSIDLLMLILQVGGSMPFRGRLPHEPLRRSRWLTAWCLLRAALYAGLHAATFVSSRAVFARSGVEVVARAMTHYVARILMQAAALLMLASSGKLAAVLSSLGALQARLRTHVLVSAKDPLVILILATFSLLYVAVAAKDIHDLYVEASSGEGAWVDRLPAIGSWVCGGFTMLSVPATLSLVVKYFTLALRSTVPPWAQLLLERGGPNGETRRLRTSASPSEVYKTSLLDLPDVASSQTQGAFPPTKPEMESFLSNVQDILIQTDEAFFLFTDYIGPVLLVWTLLTAAAFTFALYLLVDAALKGQALWEHCVIAVVVFLTFLLINVSADIVTQERRKCSWVYRKLSVHPALADLLKIRQILDHLDTPLQLNVAGFMVLGKPCVTTVRIRPFSVAITPLVLCRRVRKVIELSLG